MSKRLWLALLFWVFPALVAAQTTTNIVSQDGTTGTMARPGESSVNAIRVVFTTPGTGALVSPATDATTNTTTQTSGPQSFCNASAATPAAVGADGRSIANWCDTVGRIHIATEGIEDAAETAAAPLDMVGTVRRDTLASSAGTSGDNATLNTNSLGAVYVQPSAGPSGGASTSYTTSAASTNSTSVKGSAGNLWGISVVNTTSTIYYLRLYNSSSAPTCSSATNFIESIPIPQATGAGAGLERHHTVGQAFSTGIGFCLTGGGSSTDNTNAATGVYITLLYN